MFFDFFGYFSIPFLAAALGRETDLFATNFSSIRTAEHRQGEFLLWSLSLLIYLFLCIIPFCLRVQKQSCQAPSKDLFGKKRPFPVFFCFLFPALLLLTAIFTPYLPREEPFWSRIHVYTCVWSSVSFFILLILSVLPMYFSSFSVREGRILLCLLILCGTFCAASYLITGIVNSAMEIFYTIICCICANRIRLFFSRTIIREAHTAKRRV